MYKLENKQIYNLVKAIILGILLIFSVIIFSQYSTKHKAYLFEPIIKNLKDNSSCLINEDTKCSDIYLCGNNEYQQIDPETGKILPDVFVEPNKVNLRYKFVSNSDMQMFIIGGLHHGKEPIKFEDTRLVYMSFVGESEYNVFGLTTDMDEAALIKKYGEPESKSTYNNITYYSYIFKKDNCTYLVSVAFFKGIKNIRRIDINVDNQVIYQKTNDNSSL